MKSPRGRLLRVPAAAAFLGLSVDQVRRLIRARELAVIRFEDGRLRGLYEQDCETWVQQHREPAIDDGRTKVSPASADVDAQMARLIRHLEGT